MLLSVSGFTSTKTVQIRIYNVTTAIEVVAWTSIGVSERADGQGYSTYYYSYALVAGSEYIVDWQDNSTPVATASEGINVLQSGVAQITAKLPTNYIMGSSVQTDKNDEIDDIKTEVLTHPTLAEIEATTVLAKEATSQTILTDTGTDGVVVAVASKVGYALSSVGIDAILDDTPSAELASIPTTTGTLRQMIQFLFQYFRNKKTVTATTETLYKEDASTSLGSATISDDGATFIKGELS